MSKARQLADLGNVYDDGALSNRSLIINGAMQIFQRSPITGIGDPSAYTLDRWYMAREASGMSARFTVTQESLSGSDAPRTTDGLSTTMKIDVTTASGGISAGQSHYMTQRIEGQNIHQLNYGNSDGKTCTVSFWLKTDTKTGTMCVSAYHGGNKNYIQEISATTSWTKYTLQIPADTATSFDNNTSNGFQLMFVLSGGSNFQATKDQWNSGFDNCTSNQADFTDSTSNNIYLTGVQLEVGDTATPFEHRSYGDTLNACRRYFQRHDNANSAYRWFGAGYTTSTTTGWYGVTLDPIMRTTPTLTTTDATKFIVDTSAGALSTTALSLNFSSPHVARIAPTVSGATAGTPSWLGSNGDSALRALYFDAEL